LTISEDRLEDFEAFVRKRLLANVQTAQSSNGLELDGAVVPGALTDDFVDLSQNFAFEATDSFTIEAWVKTDVTGLMQIVSKLGIEENTFRGWGMQLSSMGTISGYVSTEWFNNFRYVEGTAFVADGQWHHVALSFDGADTIQLYVDGQPDANSDETIAGALTSIETTSGTHIGNYDGNGNPGEYFFGNIDEIRIWDTVRTAAEILENYNSEMGGTETNLIGYYKLDVPNSTCDVQDCNSNEAHGTRMGSNGTNDLAQFSDDVPTLADVPCGATIDCQILGITSNNLAQFSLFPSPASNVVNIAGIDMNGQEVQIYNALGRLVNTQVVADQSIDVSSLNSGLYFISFDVEGQSVSRKIIKR
ncbi:MAG: LamG-like jellyroll fold domain-containing protein, partial [Bacteroidota bacterium]